MQESSPHHSFYDNSEGLPLRCPFHHQPTKDTDIVHADVVGASHGHINPVPVAHQVQMQVQGECDENGNVLSVYQQQPDSPEQDINVMPPEHAQLAKGYTGSTCPFLDHNESLSEGGLDGTPCIDPTEETDFQMNRASEHPYDNTNASIRTHLENENENENGKIVGSQLPILEEQIICGGNAFKNVNVNVNDQLQDPLELTPVAARQKMDSILAAQRQAFHAIEQAKQQILQAQANLAHAERNKESIDSSLTSSTQDLTDSLLQEDTQWNIMYRKLAQYKQQYGHCDVKRHWSKEEKRKNPELAILGTWVGKTRQEGRRTPTDSARLEPYKIVALHRLGFDFSPRDNAWMQNFDKIRDYIRQNPGKLPQRRKDPLGTWCNGQIVEYNKFIAGDKKAYITQKKIDMLNAIGFVWDRASNTWSQRYENLKDFHAIHGHCRIPKNYKDQVLYRWITKERIKYRNYLKNVKPCHTEEQKNLLDNIGFMDGDRIKARTCPHGTKRNLERVTDDDEAAKKKMTKRVHTNNFN